MVRIHIWEAPRLNLVVLFAKSQIHPDEYNRFEVQQQPLWVQPRNHEIQTTIEELSFRMTRRDKTSSTVSQAIHLQCAHDSFAVRLSPLYGIGGIVSLERPIVHVAPEYSAKNQKRINAAPSICFSQVIATNDHSVAIPAQQ